MGTSLLDYLKDRVDETTAKLEDAKKRTAEAKADEDELASDLSGYQRALAAEMRRVNGPQVARAQDDGSSLMVGVRADLLGEVPTEFPSNKTEQVYKFIVAHPSGLTPPEIYHGIAKGLNVHRNYLYAMLGRMETRGRIRKVDGKYVAAGQAPFASKVIAMG